MSAVIKHVSDASFDKVYSVHTLYFWERPVEVVGTPHFKDL
jgi:hypothetical protein